LYYIAESQVKAWIGEKMVLNDISQEIYSRQLIMAEIKEKGQKKFFKSSVLVVGCGGLGAPALYYLAAMGIGCLGVCDGDTVSFSNLNRQILYVKNDIEKPKAITAKKRLEALNPDLEIKAYDQFMDIQLADELIPKYDVIVDCLDNFETRFILNDKCVKACKPLIHGGVNGFSGQLMTIIPGKGPCLRCLFPNGIRENNKEKPPGVIGPTPGVIGAMQALETAKYLLGLEVCDDGLVTYDGLSLTMEKVFLEPSITCFCRK